MTRISAKPAIVIGATFVAEPVGESLRFWSKKLSFMTEIEFIAYNNIVQVLLDGRSRFVSNRNGLNVVLLRFEDWFRFHQAWSLPEARARNQNFLTALSTAAARCPSPILVCVCPPSSDVFRHPVQRALFVDLEKEIAAAINKFGSLHYLSSQYLREFLGAGDYYDAGTDRLGHIPFTPEAYAGLGTAIFRVFHSLRHPAHKVIVADCDNTLWKGVCGEVGPSSVEVDDPSRVLQTFLKARQQNGILLCMCSKNILDDVSAVFDTHTEMPLKWSDFVAMRINWSPKSENIRSLARELSLGLDSFIFLDDNPAEVAEVRAQCPQVRAITLPANRELIPRFLEHLWAFDQSTVTQVDRSRTELYRQESMRRAAAATMSYADFLAELGIKIDIRELQSEAEIDRAAQMTQRTSQFNFTTRRYSAPELREAINTDSINALTAFVSDRYGDYGQVGLMIYEAREDGIRIDTFLLSCRALGKGVEHAMMARLGNVAVASLRFYVEIEFIPTAKNLPAWQFLKSIEAVPSNSVRESGFVFPMPSKAAENVHFSVSPEPPERSIEMRGEAAKPANLPVDYEWIASICLHPHTVLKAVEAEAAPRSAPTSPVLPTTELERTIQQVWEGLLRASPIGVHDNFFDLGGDSLLAVCVIASLNARLDLDLPLTFMIEAPTIAEFARQLQSDAPKIAKCVVPLKISGVLAPFFCVHGVGGSILELMDLAGHMDQDQPFYGIQAIGLAAQSPLIPMTVEEMGERYIQEVREIQPEGPYYIGGSSFGGLVAYEMARQLTSAGHLVALVALFDTSVPGVINSQGSARRWRHQFENLLYRCSLHLGNIGVLSSKNRIQYVYDKLCHSIGRRELPERIRATRELMQSASNRYVPQPYSGNVTLFRATKQPPWILADPLLGWGALVKGSLNVCQTPGHHADLVRNPRAQVLARQLHDALSEARAEVRNLLPTRTD